MLASPRTRGVDSQQLTDVEFVPARQSVEIRYNRDYLRDSPHKVDCLDNEPECWAHGGHIFVHDSLNNGRFACIIQASVDPVVRRASPSWVEFIQHQYSHLLVF